MVKIWLGKAQNVIFENSYTFIGGRMTPGGGQGNGNGGGYQNGGSAGYQNGVNGLNGMAQIQMLSQQATR